jgi:hypothetical protein
VAPVNSLATWSHWETDAMRAATTLAEAPGLVHSHPQQHTLRVSDVAGVRFRLVNSLATQAEPSTKGWDKPPIGAVALDEQAVQVKLNQARFGVPGKKAACPLSGNFPMRDAAALRSLKRREVLVRDVNLVRDLI